MGSPAAMHFRRGEPAWLTDKHCCRTHEVRHVSCVTEHAISITAQCDETLDLSLELLVAPADHHRLEVILHSEGLLHDRLRVRTAGRARRDQQGGLVRSKPIAPEDC